MANKVHRSINVGEHNPTPPIGINMFETIIFNVMRRKGKQKKHTQRFSDILLSMYSDC